MNEIAVIIPVYEPSDVLIDLIRTLQMSFRNIIVVDDGSRSRSEIFNQLSRENSVTLLRHRFNRGKGAALKTAFSHILSRPKTPAAAVTIDADGQHLPQDILRVAEETLRNPDRITLGVRGFSGDIPFRSRFGNLWTRYEFRLLTAVDVKDTQTGLRGIPSALLPDILEIPGDKYEYESRMLAYAACCAPAPALVPITTVYLDGNSSSHFRPFIDTLRTQSALISAALSYRRMRRSCAPKARDISCLRA